jgi:hypothetical protein
MSITQLGFRAAFCFVAAILIPLFAINFGYAYAGIIAIGPAIMGLIFIAQIIYGLTFGSRRNRPVA